MNRPNPAEFTATLYGSAIGAWGNYAEALESYIQFLETPEITSAMLEAATTEYDEWADENKGSFECFKAILSKALNVNNR